MPASPAPVQLYLRAKDKPLFAVYHPTRSESDPRMQPGAAVLMLGAWGAEDMSSHRGWRGLAQSLAERGCPVLRVDWDGCGDSSDLPDGADHWQAWQTSVGDAIHALQGLSGVRQVTLVGLRLGALLAATACVARKDVQHLVMLAPVRSGKAYLRELRMLGGAMAQGSAGQEGGLLAAGFELNMATVDAVAQATWPATLQTPVVTVVDRDDLGTGEAWLSKLRAAGVDTEYTVQAGFQDMMLTAHKARPAQAMFDAVIDAVIRRHPARSEDAVAAQQGTQRIGERDGDGDGKRDAADPCSHVMVAGRSEAGHPVAVSESVMAPYGAMAATGIVVTPGDGVPRSGRGLLILNSSAERRIGPNRMWVTFARDRAARGDVVVRLDMPGLGESGQDYAEGSNAVYPDEAVERLQRIAGHLRAQQLAGHWGVMGLCSGGRCW